MTRSEKKIKFFKRESGAEKKPNTDDVTAAMSGRPSQPHRVVSGLKTNLFILQLFIT